MLDEIVEGFSDLKTATERALGLLAVALREHEGVAQRRLEFKLPRTPAARVIEGRECATGPDTSLVQQIELDKQSGAGAGQWHAKVGTVVLRIGPGQRGPGIGEQAGTLLRARWLTASTRFGGHGRFKHLPDVTGMPAGDLLRFAGIDELLHGIGFGGVQQAIACRGAFRPRRNQRLGDELPERVDDLIGRLAARHPRRPSRPAA